MLTTEPGNRCDAINTPILLRGDRPLSSSAQQAVPLEIESAQGGGYRSQAGGGNATEVPQTDGGGGGGSSSSRSNGPQQQQQDRLDDDDVSPLHHATHERLPSQRQRPARSAAAPWPRRWLGGRQWRWDEHRLWVSSFDGAGAGATTTATAASPESGQPKTKKKPKAAKKKRDGFFIKIANIPSKWMWFLNPRDTVFEWARGHRSESHARHKQTRAERRIKRRIKRKARKSRKARKAGKELQGDCTATTGTAAAVMQRLEEEARVREAAAAAAAATTNTSLDAASAPRLITQYGRIWLGPQAAGGDGAISYHNDNNDSRISITVSNSNDGYFIPPSPPYTGGVVAPPNSVADSAYYRLPLIISSSSQRLPRAERDSSALQSSYQQLPSDDESTLEGPALLQPGD